MRLIVSNFLMIFLIMLLLMAPATAGSSNLQNDTFVCASAAQKYEKKYQIKEHLLSTISSVESGKWNEEKNQTIAWPWTVNAEGKGMFFDSKKEAIVAIKKLQAKGVKSIDVGCMQINLVYHGKEFNSLEDAIDPQKNIEYAAKFLKKLYETQSNGDWIKAAMTYHSKLPEKANRYKGKIVVAYEKVKNRNKEIDNRFFASKKLSDELKHKDEVQFAWREAQLEEYRKSRLH